MNEMIESLKSIHNEISLKLSNAFNFSETNDQHNQSSHQNYTELSKAAKEHLEQNKEHQIAKTILKHLETLLSEVDEIKNA
ncbi:MULTISPECIES: hypothetical protein [Bacillaceae]|uniref:hypothetical protein n=1 Tax=Bacillaceae TaxID=186817 RepID=UPI000BED2597|nr:MULTISPECIES: hypothetical protein [unclassified Bacillus (in: firmicutes)]PEC51737.1 hypothetical protein CON00_01050 [Bacillus sp. AFS096315]PET71408.1 hypothetical protein CN514_06910 [Bacillus sp. AFS001701]PFM79862.1 hypothetical protein COJ46_12755 [Bacillus sp. AFS077874]